MILHHIYKELNLLLYIFINLRDFWFVILINFYEIGFVIHKSRTVILNPETWLEDKMYSIFQGGISNWWC
jgi:hypothetical protein